MTDKFSPLSLKKLYRLFIQNEKISEGFGLTEELVFKRPTHNKAAISFLNQTLDTPIGVAAGPHTQMAQNIIVSWLSGARYIELKTVQVLDELEIAKPCIDMQDEGYNCEWSQELRIEESFNEYLNAWILIHVLNHKMHKDHKTPGVIFNMSVGYNFEGVLSEKVQWFFNKMANCAQEKKTKLDELKLLYPDIHNIDIPDCISSSITLSTMHGCPPDEVEKITRYLIEERKLDTILKLNPTLIGADNLRNILNTQNNFYTSVPDIAFEHDLKYEKAVEILKKLIESADKNKVFFGIKLTNTLECINNKDVFPSDQTSMYMSGRALHPISINLAKKLQNEFNGSLNVSFSAGSDCFNIADVLKSGLYPVTVCSDILKPGGYSRLIQYVEAINDAYDKAQVDSLSEYILKSANNSNLSVKEAALKQLNHYADKVLEAKAYKNDIFYEKNIKTNKQLNAFDCIEAPCTMTCPTNQNIPEYMYHASKGDFSQALKTILETNPFPNVLGMVCDHKCQTKCTRINYDEDLRIRDVKWFVTDFADKQTINDLMPFNDKKVAVIGAGPSGLSCAYFLRLAGMRVTVFESKSVGGGMVSEAIPHFRLKEKALFKDIERIKNMGVDIKYNAQISTEAFEQIKNEYDYIYIAVGAQGIKKLHIEGEEAQGVIDPITFLSAIKTQTAAFTGKNIGIVGGGNTACDVARSALRYVKDEGTVTLIYRRSILEMPADKEEIEALLAEGIKIMELTAPLKVVTENNNVKGLACEKMKLGEKDSSGRSRPIPIEGSEFILDLDTIIPAVGQDVIVDFMSNDAFNTLAKTQTANIFVGGDALRGASTIVKAVGDGRLSAEKIIEKAGLKNNQTDLTHTTRLTGKELLYKKSKRAYSELPHASVDKYSHTAPDIPFNAENIKKEAARCLFCDDMCSICVTVCPNKANYCYTIEPFSITLPKIHIENNQTIIETHKAFSITQKYQIVNFGDFCNECGNCNTFCPTAGAPYLEKPKFYFNTQSFNQAPEGYFISRQNAKVSIVYKKGDNFHSLTLENDSYTYENDSIIAIFDNMFNLIKAEALTNFSDYEYFEKAAEMKILLNALKELY